MKNPIRITIALDEEIAELLGKMKEGSALSQSEIMRQALRFYYENKDVIDASSKKRLHIYMDMLLSGEHVILDFEHWLLLLNLIESSPEKGKVLERLQRSSQVRRRTTDAESLFSGRSPRIPGGLQLFQGEQEL